MPPKSLWDHLWFSSAPITHPFLSPSPAALPSQPLARPGRSAHQQPRSPRGRGNRPRPRPLPRDGPPSFPLTAGREPERARAPARGPAVSRERALCGRRRHVVVVVRKRRQRRWRRSSRSRRSSGPGPVPRRPWLGALWGGGGGRAVTGLAMSCRPVRKAPPPPRLLWG